MAVSAIAFKNYNKMSKISFKIRLFWISVTINGKFSQRNQIS